MLEICAWDALSREISDTSCLQVVKGVWTLFAGCDSTSQQFILLLSPHPLPQLSLYLISPRAGLWISSHLYAFFSFHPTFLGSVHRSFTCEKITYIITNYQQRSVQHTPCNILWLAIMTLLSLSETTNNVYCPMFSIFQKRQCPFKWMFMNAARWSNDNLKKKRTSPSVSPVCQRALRSISPGPVRDLTALSCMPGSATALNGVDCQ